MAILSGSLKMLPVFNNMRETVMAKMVSSIHVIRHLTEKQAAFLTGYSVYWFQRMRWQGGGPPYRKIGRSVRYPEDQLLKWLESHRLRTSTSDDRQPGVA